MSDYKRALADFDQSAALDPKAAWGVAGRGFAYLRMCDYDRALADFDQSAALDPKAEWIIARRGETYFQKGEYDLALADFHRAIALSPTGDRHFYLFERALAYRALGQKAGAATDLVSAIGGARETEVISPGNWRIKLDLALYYLASGDRATAEGRYQAAIDAKVNVGLAHRAIQKLDDYLLLFPADEAAREMRERLLRYAEERSPKVNKGG